MSGAGSQREAAPTNTASSGLDRAPLPLAVPGASGAREPDAERRGGWSALPALFRRFVADNCPTYAAALAFFGLLSLIPLLVVLVAALAFLFRSPHQAIVQLERLVTGILPGAAAHRTAQTLIANAGVERTVTTLIQTRSLAGALGAVSLLWAALQIFVNAAPAMNAAFETQETRGWLRLRLTALGLLGSTGALFLLSLLPSAGPDFVRRLHLPGLGLPQAVPWPIDLLFALVALAINVAMFMGIYRFLPNARLTWNTAFRGGLVAGILWEVAKQGFAYYLAHFARYERVYGALGGGLGLVLWIYYSALILLLGAEVASYFQRQRGTERLEER